jgi:hypothetical protein
MLYLSLHLLLRRVGTPLTVRLVSSLLLLIFTAVNFTVFKGSLMLLLPASLASLALALAFLGRPRNMAVAVPLVLSACLVQPIFGLVVWVAGLLPGFYSLRGKLDGPIARAAFSFAGLLGFVIGRNFVKPISILQPIPYFFQFQQEPVFYLLLIGASSLGLYLLWGKDNVLSAMTMAWIVSSIFLAPDATAALLFLSIPITFLTSFPLSSGLAGNTLRKVGESVVEIDLQKVAAVALVAAFLISTTSLTSSTSSALFATGNAENQSILQAASFLRGTDSTLVAPTGTLPYLSLNSGDSIPKVDSQTLSAWGETTFRLQTSYVRLDDWEPLSSSRAPRLAVSDGARYEYLLYIDDSQVQFTMKSGNAPFAVSPYGMAFLGYKWMNDSSLQARFASQFLSINKTENVAVAHAIISYQFRARGNASVSNCSMAVYAEWPFTIDSFSGQGSSFFAKSGGKYFGFLASPGASATFLQNQHSIMISKAFLSSGGTMTLRTDAFDARSSGVPSVAASIYDYIRSPGNNYIVAAGAPDRFSNVPTSLQQSLYIDDAYQSFGFTGQPIGAGGQYVESPYKSNVLQENASSNWRTVKYETRGLDIVKEISIPSNDSMSIRYSASCIEASCSSIRNASSYLWIPWSRYLVNSSVTGSYVNLTLDTGSLTIEFSPKPSFIAIVNTPQSAIEAIYEASGSGNLTYAITIGSKAGSSVTLQDSSRPMLTGSDVVSVSVRAGDLQLVFQAGGVRLYRVAQG